MSIQYLSFESSMANLQPEERLAYHFWCLDVWQHYFETAHQNSPYSLMWQQLNTRHGYLDLQHRCFRMPDKAQWMPFNRPLRDGIQYLESLDLGNKSLQIPQLVEYTRRWDHDRSLEFGLENRKSRFQLSPEYKSIFVIEQEAGNITINLASLSEASKYHLDTLLEYNEVEFLNRGNKGRFFRLNLHYVKKSPERTFTLFPKLAPEIRALTLQKIIETKPRRLQLTLFSQKQRLGIDSVNEASFYLENGDPSDPGFSTHESRTVPPILQLNRELRSKGTIFHDYVELKYHPGDDRGLIYLPTSDMVFISKYKVPNLDPSEFKASLITANCLQKVKSIAISTAHRHFWPFVQDFKNYSSLELVFIVLKEDLGVAVREWDVNTKDDLVDSRLSCRTEILFEVLHQSNKWTASYGVPSVKLRDRSLSSYKLAETLETLVFEMARGEGKNKVAPNIRFVRLVRSCKTLEKLEEEAWQRMNPWERTQASAERAMREAYESHRLGCFLRSRSRRL